MHFRKYHGLGNDFIITDGRKYTTMHWESLAKDLCRPRYGIGADGFIILTESKNRIPAMRIFNTDGSEAEMCGNGLRCFVHFLHDLGMRERNKKIDTLAGVMETKTLFQEQNRLQVRARLGKPSFHPQDIPVNYPGTEVCNYPLEVDGRVFNITSLSTGPPHTVLFIPSLQTIKPETLGPKIAEHWLFPNKTNVLFAQIINKENVKAVVWERGVGLTEACGTGAAAILCAGVKLGLLAKKTNVHLPGGSLKIEWEGTDHNIYMTGPSVFTFAGEVLI